MGRVGTGEGGGGVGDGDGERVCARKVGISFTVSERLLKKRKKELRLFIQNRKKGNVVIIGDKAIFTVLHQDCYRDRNLDRNLVRSQKWVFRGSVERCVLVESVGNEDSGIEGNDVFRGLLGDI